MIASVEKYMHALITDSRMHAFRYILLKKMMQVTPEKLLLMRENFNKVCEFNNMHH